MKNTNELLMKNNSHTKSKRLCRAFKKQKFGWLATIFYGFGNVIWAYANNFRNIVGENHKLLLNPAVSAVAGAFWITVIRETFYLFLFLLYAGPNLFIRRFKDTFTRGGRLMMLSVFTNFLGNVCLATGYLFLITAAFTGTITTMFVVFIFLTTFIVFKQKFSLNMFIAVGILIAILSGLTAIQLLHSDIKEGISQQIVGAALILLAQIGYLSKGVITEYVFKHKLLDVEGVQFMATFWSPFIALAGSIILLPILQPILIITTHYGRDYSYLDFTPYMLFIWMIKSWPLLVVVMIASVFLLSGRNSLYQFTRVSGTALSSAFAQGRAFLQAIGTIIIYSIVIGITKSAYPVNTNPDVDPWSIITGTSFSLWYYWVLVVAQLIVAVYIAWAGQKYWEKHQHKYRKTRGIKDEAIDYSVTDNKGIKHRKLRWFSKK